MTVKFFPNDKQSPPASWPTPNCTSRAAARRPQADRLRHLGGKTGGRNVTFPARQYTVNGERRSFALLRPLVDPSSQEKLRDLILEAFKEHEAAVAEAV
jgi:hypothetical protein